ncbi:YciI family protein [Arthrobacter yangruifuii]|uniref:YciI family protein n=1 Tax=Arthrobacter yangruifuii TaxID=2606616 RepID=UPI0031B836ED
MQASGEYIDGLAVAPEGTFVRYDGEGGPRVTDGPFAETKDRIAGWMVIDVDDYARAGELSAIPAAGGRPEQEWIELLPFLGSPITIME